MLYKLHYWFLTSGSCAQGLILGVFMQTYTDASTFEVGFMLMIMPFSGIIFRPIICAMADREQAYQTYLIRCLSVSAIGYLPFLVIPYLGPQVYELHPRVCFWILVISKVIGDTGFGGMISIGDSLAINYAARVGTDFTVYRIWGTVSWMVFGLIIGSINETPYAPKYLPAFAVLVTSNLLDILVVWLWPKEYFIMVPTANLTNNSPDEQQAQQGDSGKKVSSLTKSLLPKEVVWAHAKGQLIKLFTCGIVGKGNKVRTSTNNNLPPTVVIQSVEKQRQQPAQQQLQLDTMEKFSNTRRETKINKITQFRILMVLIRRDLRIIMYLGFFICAGLSISPLSFLFMNLSDICHEGGQCDFSQLAGMLQVTTAASETVLFIYLKEIKSKVGRLSLCAIAVGLAALKYFFYAKIWYHIHPNYSLLAELSNGLYFGIYLTLSVEMGHLFANEVAIILPELIERGVVEHDTDPEKVKLSLAATMQALITTSMDGIGRGCGALIYGLILNSHSYEYLWSFITLGHLILFSIIIAIRIIECLFHPQVGLPEIGDKSKSENEVAVKADNP